MERAEMMKILYSDKEKDEDSRLTRSRHGQLEYLTTMHYIHKFVPPASKILEVGAGTGGYKNSGLLFCPHSDSVRLESVRK